MAADGKIFVSYRREDAPGEARSIYERLGRSFGESNIFMDVDQLLAGQRFDRELDKALAECDVLIAMIGARWMELLSAYARTGKRDYVRDEIAAALQRDIIVILVIMNIRDLMLYQKHNIAQSFGRDAAHLITALQSLLRKRRGPRRWRAVAVTGVSGLALTGVLLGYLMWIAPPIKPKPHTVMDELIITAQPTALPDTNVAAASEPTFGVSSVRDDAKPQAPVEPAANSQAPFGTATSDGTRDQVAGTNRPHGAKDRRADGVGRTRTGTGGGGTSGQRTVGKQLVPTEQGRMAALASIEPVAKSQAMEQAPNIAGRWRDNWGVTYDIEQQAGTSFRYSASGPSCSFGYRIKSIGLGHTGGLGFTSAYQSDHKGSYNSKFRSHGQCRSELVANGTKMNLTCDDTKCGTTHYSLTRQ